MANPTSNTKSVASVGLIEKELENQRTLVTQLKAENAILKQKQHHQLDQRQWVETVRMVLFAVDGDFRFTFASPVVETYTTLTPRKIAGQPLMDFIHKDDVRMVHDRFLRSVPNGHQTFKCRFGCPALGFRWMKASLSPLVKKQECLGFQGVLMDIEKNQRDPIHRAFKNNRRRDIIGSIQEGYFETDLEGKIEFCNNAIIAISGYRREELVGKTFREFTSPHNARAIQVAFSKAFENDQFAQLANYEVYHKEGHTLTVEVSVSLIQDKYSKPVGFRCVLRDISEQIKAMEKQERMQEQIIQSRKMNALGTLAGGLAHGFNNVLMAIQGNLALIRMNLPQDHPMQKNLERINESAEKGSHLAREILSFAKIGKFVVMPTNLNKIIKSTSRMLIRSHPKLKVHEILEDALWQTHVDRVQIGQVLLSLYLNAVDAMPEGGDLYIQSENVILDEASTRPFEAEPGRYVKISVTDSGEGLCSDAKERIFEPFFSAYRPLRYDKLGLASAYGTIQSHKGIINVYSEEGNGTTLTFYLPAAAGQLLADSHSLKSASGSETLLLVDDDKMSIRSGRAILERQGYHVMTASNGSEAIDIYKNYHKQIDLVLLDMILTDFRGDQVFQELKRYNPNVVVIVISGYNVNRHISTLLSEGCADFIQKPFQSYGLANSVRTALDRHMISVTSAE